MSSPADQPANGVGHDPVVAACVAELYADHASVVRSVCRSLLHDRAEVEDAVQQTFLSAQRAIATGTSPRDGAAWLATIARHECLARVCARMREPLPSELDEDGAAPDTHAAAVLRQEVAELRKALAELPAQQREAILLREVRGLSYQEVASSLSVTTSAVESLLFRARRGLQTRLREALALFPCWGQSVREFAMRVGGSGVEAPTAAKVAAVGVGTALFAGGALAPTMIGLGHAPSSGPHVARPAAHRIVDAAPSDRPARLVPTSSGVHVREGRGQPNDASDTSKVSAVVSSSGGSEREGERSTRTGTRHDGSDRSESSNRTSGSSDDSNEQDDGNSDDSGAGTTTTSTTTGGTSTSGATTTSTTTTYPVTTDD